MLRVYNTFVAHLRIGHSLLGHLDFAGNRLCRHL
jgi:hypothetical protein